MLGQHQNITFALAQRRDSDNVERQPVQQIGAELVLRRQRRDTECKNERSNPAHESLLAGALLLFRIRALYYLDCGGGSAVVSSRTIFQPDEVFSTTSRK